MEELETLKRRLSKIGIEISLVSNYPWIYLYRVNGKFVRVKYMSDHGFTLAYKPNKENKRIQLTNISKTFETIRKYL